MIRRLSSLRFFTPLRQVDAPTGESLGMVFGGAAARASSLHDLRLSDHAPLAFVRLRGAASFRELFRPQGLHRINRGRAPSGNECREQRAGR
jgi:hypothetical protein